MCPLQRIFLLERVCEELTFQVRVTNGEWLNHLAAIGCLDAANFWTNRPYRGIGDQIIFVRQGTTPRRIAGWGTLELIGEMTSPDQLWDARDCDGETSSGANSMVADFTHYMILRDVELLGDNGPLETDIFNEENGYGRFDTNRGGSKNYDGDFPVLLGSPEARDILAERAEIGATEGGARYVRHRQIERRTHRLRSRMISRSRAENEGRVPCEACETDMLGRYNLDAPIIDCHHLFPLSELDGEERETTLEDLALLCPSCHRAIHRQDDCSNLDELRRRLRE